MQAVIQQNSTYHALFPRVMYTYVFDNFCYSWPKICIFKLLYLFLDILPYKVTDENVQVTKEFLQKIVDILLDFVKDTNDRNVKLLDFRHPEEMQKLLDLRIPEKGLSLQQLINDCATTLKYQVKTGK